MPSCCQNLHAETYHMMHADDDPIVSGSIIDWNQVPDNKNLIVLTTKRGGHCSWYQGLFPIGDAWSDRVAVKFISSVLESHSHTNFLVRVIRKSIRAEPNLKREVSMERLARICSAADMQSSGIPFKGGGNGRGNRNSKGYLLQR